MFFCLKEKVLHFKQPAGTSRGVYTTRKSWFVHLSDGEREGVGECAPLPDLSCDARPDYAEVLKKVCEEFCQTGEIDYERLRDYPSMLFGLETALLSLRSDLSPLTPHFSPLTTHLYYSIRLSVAVRWAFPSTVWCGWAAMRRC